MKALKQILSMVLISVVTIEIFSFFAVLKLEVPEGSACVSKDWIRYDCQQLYYSVNPNAFNVVCLGDSFTFGHGIEDYADTWPALLQEKLSNDPIVVHNFGQRGSNSRDQVIHFSLLANKMDIDMLIWQYNWNDVQPLSHYPSVLIQQFYKRNRPISRTNSFKFFSYLFKYPKIFAYVDSSTASFYGVDTEEWKMLVSSFERMNFVCGLINAPVKFIIYPNIGDTELAYADQVMRVAQSQGFECYLPRFTDGMEFSDYVISKKDAHPNVKCNHWFIDELMNLGLADSIRRDFLYFSQKSRNEKQME